MVNEHNMVQFSCSDKAVCGNMNITSPIRVNSWDTGCVEVSRVVFGGQCMQQVRET